MVAHATELVPSGPRPRSQSAPRSPVQLKAKCVSRKGAPPRAYRAPVAPRGGAPSEQHTAVTADRARSAMRAARPGNGCPRPWMKRRRVRNASGVRAVLGDRSHLSSPSRHTIELATLRSFGIRRRVRKPSLSSSAQTQTRSAPGPVLTQVLVAKADMGAPSRPMMNRQPGGSYRRSRASRPRPPAELFRVCVQPTHQPSRRHVKPVIAFVDSTVRLLRRTPDSRPTS